MLKKIFQWMFRDELNELKSQRDELKRQKEDIKSAIIACNRQQDMIKNLLGNFDVSVDVHQYGRSWAAISIQGRKEDFIKFVDLGNAEIIEIQRFLKRYERSSNIKVDAAPQASQFLKFTR